MIEPELSDKLLQAFETCAIHLKRMEFARSKVEAIIPLTREKYSRMDEEKIEGINMLFDSVEGINIIIERCRSLLNKHN